MTITSLPVALLFLRVHDCAFRDWWCKKTNKLQFISTRAVQRTSWNWRKAEQIEVDRACSRRSLDKSQGGIVDKAGRSMFEGQVMIQNFSGP